MKAKKLFPVLTFLAGLIAGGSLLAILGFSSPAPAPPPISASDANTFFHNYLRHAPVLNNYTFRGFTIDKAQYDAMKALIDANPSLVGFRIYHGIDNSSVNIGIVVGINSLHQDVTGGNGIYRANSTEMGPCPTLCDAQSAITKD